MATMAIVSVQNLYPIERNTEVAGAIKRLLTPERHDDGTAKLRYPPSSLERSVLQHRLSAIVPHLGKPKPKELAKVITDMLVGFGNKNQDARAMVAQYTAVLSGLPFWAVAQACGRFTRGEVKPEDVDSDRPLDTAFPPTTAQLCKVARKIAEPFLQEMFQIGMVLHGRAEDPDPSPEERERVVGKLKGLTLTLRENARADNEADAAEKERATERVKMLAQLARDAAVLEEYRQIGLEPKLDEAGRPISLSLLKTLGWKIDDHHPNGPVLIREMRTDSL